MGVMGRALPLLLLLLTSACAHWRRSSEGLLEGELPHETLGPPGSLGLSRVEIASKRVVLPSGVRLGIEKAPTHGMVGVILTVGAGTAASPEGKDELAHLVEHLALRSRPEGPGTPTIMQQLFALQAADLNGETREDSTTFYAFVPAANVHRLLGVWAALLQEPLANLTEEDLGYEQAIVQNELRERELSLPRRIVQAWVNSALYVEGSGRARALASARGDLMRMTLEDAKTFVDTWYRHPRASVFLIGDFEDPDEIVQHLPMSLVLGSTRPEPLPPIAEEPSPMPPEPPGGIHRLPLTESDRYLTVAWKLPGPFSEAGPLARIVSSQAAVAHYGRVLRQFDHVLDVWGGSSSNRDATVFKLSLQLAEGADAKAFKELAQGVVAAMYDPATFSFLEPYLEWDFIERGVWRPGASRAILQRHSAANALFGAESFREGGLEHARFFHEIGTVSAFTKTVVQIVNAKDRQLADFGRKWLGPEHTRTLLIEPAKTNLVFVENVGAPFSPPVDRPFTPLFEPESDPPVFVGAPLAFEDITYFHLPNGLEVVVVPRHDFPAVTVGLGFSGGTSAGNPPGVVELIRYFETGIYADSEANGLFLRTLEYGRQYRVRYHGSDEPLECALLAGQAPEGNRRRPRLEIHPDAHRQPQGLGHLADRDALGARRSGDVHALRGASFRTGHHPSPHRRSGCPGRVRLDVAYAEPPERHVGDRGRCRRG